MARWKKTIAKILTAQADRSIDFADFEGALKGVGYSFDRQEGSHKTYAQEGWKNIVAVAENGKAKPYQIRDFRKELKRHGY